MSQSPWLALAVFTFVASITPGPNNLLATASGARFGLRRTLPQVAGVTFGFTVLLALSTWGVAELMVAQPRVAFVLALAGYGYLAWLSWKLIAAAWHAGSSIDAGLATLRPMPFWHAAAFQFANPKAWMMALSAATGIMADLDRSPATMLALGLLFAAINFPCVGAWAWMGSSLRGWLNDPLRPWRLRGFNLAMGGSLAATLCWMIAHR